MPDVNVSALRSSPPRCSRVRTVEPAARTVIPFGLSAIRNVGEGLVERIIAEREQGGPFADFYDFCARVDPVVLNKRTVESLIKAGAFDALGHPRQGLCLVFEQIVDRTLARRREADQGVMSLFGDLGDGGATRSSTTPGCRSPTRSSTRPMRLAFEKEMLGLYLSDHPLKGAGGGAAPATPTPPSPSCARAASDGRDALGRRRGHRRGPQVHQAGRADGHLRPRGPGVLHRGLGVPPDHDRGRPTCSPTTPSSASRAGWTCATTSPSWSAWRSSGPSSTLDGPSPSTSSCPIHALTDERVESPQAPARRAPRAVAGAAARRDQVHPAGLAVERRHHAAGCSAELRVLLGPGLPGSSLESARPPRPSLWEPCGSVN